MHLLWQRYRRKYLHPNFRSNLLFSYNQVSSSKEKSTTSSTTKERSISLCFQQTLGLYMKETRMQEILLLCSAVLERLLWDFWPTHPSQLPGVELRSPFRGKFTYVYGVTTWHNNKCMKDPKIINTNRGDGMPGIVALIF